MRTISYEQFKLAPFEYWMLAKGEVIKIEFENGASITIGRAKYRKSLSELEVSLEDIAQIGPPTVSSNRLD